MFLKHAYAGTPHIRQLLATDRNLKALDGHKKVEWSPSNDHTAEVSDAVGRWLLDNEPGDWEVVDDASSVEGASSSSGSGEDDEGRQEAGTAPITTGARTRRSS